MATQKLQVGRALSVIPSDNCEVPFPATTIISSCSGVSANQLIDTGINFQSYNVQTGDIVYNTSSGEGATVVRVVSTDTIDLNANIFLAAGDDYKIFAKGNNDGCVLYIGVAGDLYVQTIGGDVVTFTSVLAGQFIPVKILKVLGATTASQILALW